MAQLVGHTDQIGQLKLNTVPHGLLAQLVEHIVHIDGVTGSSPVQTTTIRPKATVFGRIFC